MKQTKNNFLKSISFIKLSCCLFFLNASAPPPSTEFPDCPESVTSSNIGTVSATIKSFFHTRDPSGDFERAVFPRGVPTNKTTYNAMGNPKNVYTTWYNALIAKTEAETTAKEHQEKFSDINGKLSQIASQLGVHLSPPKKEKPSERTPNKGTASKQKKSSPFKHTPTRHLVDILGNALSKNQQEMQRIQEERDAFEAEAKKLQQLADRVTTLSPEAKLHRQTSVQLSKKLKEAEERLKTTEQRLQDLEARLGQEAIGAIHDSEPATAMTLGRVVKLNPLEHLQQSYMGMIDEIGQASESNVQDDSNDIRGMVEKAVTLFADMDEIKLEDIRSEALTLTQSAFNVVSRYEDIKFDAFGRKISEAKNLAILKKTVIDDIFYDVFLSKMSELELRILNLDVLQQSLDLTKAYQEQLQRLIELNICAPAKLSSLRQFLTLSENTFKIKIEERDAAIRDAYQPSLVTVQEEINQRYAEYQKRKLAGTIPKEHDFAFIPVPLQLMRSPLAFFSLAKSDFTDKKFNDIQIMDQSLIYLTRDQTRAFFVYLYDVSMNFSDYKKKYEEMTLASAPPLQQKDVQELIKAFRNRLKTYFLDNKKRMETNEDEVTRDQSTEKTAAEKPNFSPAFNDRRSFREFAEIIDDLVTGAYALKVIKKQLESLRVEFNHKLSGVTIKGVEAVMRTETSERVQMVQKILSGIEKFSSHVPQQGGIEAITSQNIPQLKDLISEMKATQKEIDDRNFPIRKLIESSTDFTEGSQILESAVITIAKAPLPAAKVATPIKKRPPAPGRPAIALTAPSAESLTTELDILAQQLEEKRTSSTIAEDKYQELMTRIQAARDNVAADALQQAQMKIKSLKRDLK